jgi:DNA repair exonuclease SbcCD nuclease subunit
MPSFIYRTDTHVADRSPISWKGDYPAEIWENVRQIGVLARERGASAILDGGDYFHVKAASRNSHGLVEHTARLHQDYTCPVHCVEGNHDIAYNDLASIERQPLGVLYAAGVFKQLRETVFDSDGVRVRVVGMPYSPHRTADEIRAVQKKPGDDFLVVIIHQLASENPPASVEDFFGEPVFRYAELLTEDGPDVFAFGHWHKDQGIVDLRGRKFVNLGAVSRGALIRENLERTPKVAHFEFTKGSFRVTPIPLVVAAPADVFDLDRKEREEKEGKEIEQFVERLKNDANIDPSASIEETLASMSYARDVQDLAREYLQRARAEVG